MKRKSSWFVILLCLWSVVLILSACGGASSSSGSEEKPKKDDKYEKLVKEKNAELELEPIELTSFGEEMGVTFEKPVYQKFAVNGEVVVDGEIETFSELKSDYAWIRVYSDGDAPAGDQHEYYTPIKEGKFKQAIHFFNGEGEYRVKVQLPSSDREDYFYDTIEFEVVNVNPEQRRDVTYTPFGRDADLSLNIDSSYLEKDGLFSLKGEAGKLTNDETIMISLKKDSEQWEHVMPVKNGKFKYDIPLFFGEGVHELEVLVPDKEREDYYQKATTILIDNKSTKTMTPIEFSKASIERGVTLESPVFGEEVQKNTFNIKGSIDPKAELAAKTSHIYITTKKREDEALDVIPVKDFKFDDSFYLRFGPGTYEVIVSVPEIHEGNRDYFRYFGVAQFKLEASSIEDQRDILPSRGVQSDAPQIIELSQQLTKDKSTNREKAKAIYDYVAQNITYDVQKYKNDEFAWDDSALKTLEEKTGVCQDYAFLAIALLRASDIEARFVEGRAGGGIWPGRHAWVEANVDGSWLTMDPTWASGYLKDDQFVASFNETYFDPNMAEFEKTHTRTGVAY